MAKVNLNKLVASNVLNANRNLLSSLERDGRKGSVLYLTTLWENQRIVKRYPSLR